MIPSQRSALLVGGNLRNGSGHPLSIGGGVTAVCRCNAGIVLLRAVDGELSRHLTDKIDRMNHLAAGRHGWPIGTGMFGSTSHYQPVENG